MTLPVSFPLSMSQIATELGLPPITQNPLSINHAWVIALAGKSALPVSFSDLLGKTGHFSGNLTGSGVGPVLQVIFGNAPFFGGQLSSATQQNGAITLSFSSAPNYGGTILLSNPLFQTSSILTKSNSTTWTGTGYVLPNNSSTVPITVYPT